MDWSMSCIALHLDAICESHTHGNYNALTTTGRILCMDLRRAGQLPLGGRVAPPPREFPANEIMHSWEAFCTFSLDSFLGGRVGKERV